VAVQRKRTKKRYCNESFLDRFLTLLFYPLRVFIYYFLFQFVFRILFKFRHRVTFDKNGKKLPRGNFIVLGNHVSNWDGLYLNTYLCRFIYFLVHDEAFKYKIASGILTKVLGQIKRGNKKSDIGPLRKLIDIRNSGKNIGIFPEGDISHVGKSLHIRESIAKLCKILDLPVVTVRIDGAFHARPRWGYEVRKTKVRITITDVISREEVEGFSQRELYERIVEGIRYNDNEYQKTHMIKAKAKRPAERLENVLFLCPDCGRINCMKSSVDRLFCSRCGYEVRFNEYNQFELICGSNHFLNIEEWDEYQKAKLAEIVEWSRESGQEILSFDGFTYDKVFDGQYFYRPKSRGTLSINHERLKFVSEDGCIVEEYPVKEIRDLYIQFKGTVEFTFGKHRYRFMPDKLKQYGYWYECFINAILKGQKAALSARAEKLSEVY